MKDENEKDIDLENPEVAKGLCIKLQVDFGWHGDTVRFTGEVWRDGVHIANVDNDGRGGDTDIQGVPGLPTSKGIWLSQEAEQDILRRLQARFGDVRAISPSINAPVTLGSICEELACAMWNRRRQV